MKKLCLALLTVGLLFTGCSLFTPVTYSSNFTINGLVTDGQGKIVDNANVLWTWATNASPVVTPVTSTTTASGTYLLTGAANGTYNLRITKTAYTVAETAVTVDGTSVLIPNMGLTEYKSTTGIKSTIYPTTPTNTVTFKVKVVDNNYKIQNIDSTNIKIVAKLQIKDTSNPNATTPTYIDDPVNAPFPASIDATTGAVSFAAIPQAPRVKIQVLPFTDANGNNYDGTDIVPSTAVSSFDLVSGSVVLSDQVLAPNTTKTAPAIVTHNMLPDFVVGADVTVSFNKKMNTSQTTFTLTDNAGTVTLTTLVTWAADGKSVTINPEKELAVGTSYKLTSSLTSSDGFTATDTKTFTTVKGIAYASSNFLTTDYDLNRQAITVVPAITFTEAISRVSSIVLYKVGATNTPVQATITTSGSTLTITPLANLINDSDYLITGTIYGSSDGASNSITFSGASTIKLQFRTVAASTVLTLTAPSIVQVSGETWDYNTSAINIQFNEVESAKSYIAYGRVVGSGTDWFQISTFTTAQSDYNPASIKATIIRSLNLNQAALTPYFDKYKDDAIYTPFAGGQKIEIKLVALNGENKSADSNILSYLDNVAPTLASVVYPAVWTVGTTAASLLSGTFNLTYSEYLKAFPPAVTTGNLTSVTYLTGNWLGAPTSSYITMQFPASTVISTSAVTYSYLQFTITDSSGNVRNVRLGFDAGGVRTITYP